MPQTDFWPFAPNKLSAAEDDEKAVVLQKQLVDMEREVKDIQMELASIRRDRQDLQNRKQLMTYSAGEDEFMKEFDQGGVEDKLLKYSEISTLREELTKAKNAADEEKLQREKYELKLKDLETKLNSLCGNAKTSDNKLAPIPNVRKFSDDEILTLKSEIRDMKDEMEEMRITTKEKNEQLQEYRVKYLQAQQHAEELRRQLESMEFDNKHVSDQIQIEIQKMKMQFQEKLQELAPLPDLLKGAQIQLQEARQLQRLAEDNSQELASELNRVKEKLVMAVNSLNQEKAERNKFSDENKLLRVAVDERQREIDVLSKSVDEYKCNVLRLEEKLSQQDIRYKEKVEECTQLIKEMDLLREESARSLGRCKERGDSMRRFLQTQISELERQLIQSRAHCSACQKERDEIRQRMQIQINNLQENFDLVELRLRTLQGQINSLKNSYTVILADDEEETSNCDFVKIATS